jgi:DNA-binding MarR family transcriptional regulator
MTEFLDLYGKTSKVVRAASENAMQRHGIHLGQNILLAVLWEKDGRTPGEVGVAAGVSTPTVVKMATRMTAAGLVTRRGDEHDNRLVRLWLTRAGRALQEPIETERRALEAAMTANLTAIERKHLVKALTKILESATTLLAEPL